MITKSLASQEYLNAKRSVQEHVNDGAKIPKKHELASNRLTIVGEAVRNVGD